MVIFQYPKPCYKEPCYKEVVVYNDIDVGVGEMNINFYTPPHNSGGVLWFHIGRPCVCPSVHRTYVRPSIFVSVW